MDLLFFCIAQNLPEKKNSKFSWTFARFTGFLDEKKLELLLIVEFKKTVNSADCLLTLDSLFFSVMRRNLDTFADGWSGPKKQ